MLRLERLKVKSDLIVQSQVQKWFEQFCLDNICHKYSSNHQFYRLNLALAEGFSNAVRHAHQELPTDTIIEIELAILMDELRSVFGIRENHLIQMRLRNRNRAHCVKGAMGGFYCAVWLIKLSTIAVRMAEIVC
jgi:hypothetical protein